MFLEIFNFDKKKKCLWSDVNFTGEKKYFEKSSIRRWKNNFVNRYKN